MDETWYTIEHNTVFPATAIRLVTVIVRFTKRQVTVSPGTKYERRFQLEVWDAQQTNGASVYARSPLQARDRFVAHATRDLLALDMRRARLMVQIEAAKSVQL